MLLHLHSCCVCNDLPYSGVLLEVKTCMNFVFYLICKNPHTGLLSNTAFTSYDLLSTSHGYQRRVCIHVCQWSHTCFVYMYIVYTSNLTLQKTRDGGCCPPLVGKAEFANVSLPTVLINLGDIHSRLGCYIANVGCSSPWFRVTFTCLLQMYCS